MKESREDREQFDRIFRALEAINGHLRKIIMTQDEVVVQLNQVNTNLQAANAEITKVGGETDTLIQQIADLKVLITSGAVGQALVDAVQGVIDQATVVKTGLDSIDSKVPDAVVGAPAAKKA